ncbi:MAG: hypothetical protein U5K27_09610 [Desulfotignum sp.]|nr:hypothetical protein [Desulfotignum sp.]
MNNVFLGMFRLGVLEEVDRLKEASMKMEVFGKNEYDNFKKNVEKKTKALDEWEGAVLHKVVISRMNELNNTLPNLHKSLS